MKGESNMKETYETPKLIIHGSVEDMTRVIGPSSAADTLQIGGSIIQNTTGSGDFTG